MNILSDDNINKLNSLISQNYKFKVKECYDSVSQAKQVAVKINQMLNFNSNNTYIDVDENSIKLIVVDRLKFSSALTSALERNKVDEKFISFLSKGPSSTVESNEDNKESQPVYDNIDNQTDTQKLISLKHEFLVTRDFLKLIGGLETINEKTIGFNILNMMCIYKKLPQIKKEMIELKKCPNLNNVKTFFKNLEKELELSIYFIVMKKKERRSYIEVINEFYDTLVKDFMDEEDSIEDFHKIISNRIQTEILNYLNEIHDFSVATQNKSSKKVTLKSTYLSARDFSKPTIHELPKENTTIKDYTKKLDTRRAPYTLMSFVQILRHKAEYKNLEKMGNYEILKQYISTEYQEYLRVHQFTKDNLNNLFSNAMSSLKTHKNNLINGID